MKTIGLLKNCIKKSLRLNKSNYTYPEIEYVWPAENRDVVYGFGDTENRVFIVTRSVLDKENDKIDDICEGISQT